MPKFKCQNIRCTKFEEPVTVIKVRWVFDNELKKLVIKDKIYCSECKSELEHIKNDGPIECNLLRFDSMSPEDKRAMLKKRNREHYEKHDKQRVESMRKQIIQDNRNQFKPQ